MITIKELAMNYGPRLLFDQVNLLLNKGKRYAIVGANGTGKSTLLRIMMEKEAASAGEVNIPRGTKIGWVKQDHYQYENDRILDVVIQGKKELWSAFQQKDQLLEGTWSDATAYRLAEVEEVIGHNDGYVAEGQAHTLLNGLGVNQADHLKPLSTLSGGYKMRVLLAQALFENPDVLLLDEPTNHLDIFSIDWLEEHLINKYKGVLVFISHDIRFLNSVSHYILDIDYGEILEYPGNYNEFILKKDEVVQQKLHAKKHTEDKIAEMQKFVDKFKAKASKAKQAASRAKMIDKMVLPDIKKSSRVSPKLEFKCRRASGKSVLKVENLSKSYADKLCLNKVKLSIKRGEKVAIIGPNGIGKSTLLKIALGLVEPDQGEIEWGYETHTAYFAQDHQEQLRTSISVYDWLCEQAEGISTSSVRSVLGQVLFTKDEVEKSVANISGGEAARLLLAKIMLFQPNVLILDEPTNHLDIEGIEALSQALQKYTGTIILVSHDRHFVSKITNRVLAITEKKVHDYVGTYEEYLKYYKKDYLA
jgi:ATPase subunit of ABC transporter with duplicated ATPase domains